MKQTLEKLTSMEFNDATDVLEFPCVSVDHGTNSKAAASAVVKGLYFFVEGTNQILCALRKSFPGLSTQSLPLIYPLFNGMLRFQSYPAEVDSSKLENMVMKYFWLTETS
jgi:hypothetical protein